METDDSYRTFHFHEQMKQHSHAGFVPGLILVGIGALFFLNNLHIIYVREWFAYWPVVLIAFGIVKLVDSTFPGGRVLGGCVIGLGVVLLARSFGYVQFSPRDMWPLLLIGLGLLMLFNRAQGFGPELWRPRDAAPGRLNAAAVFGGGKRVINDPDFQGGEISAVFGGFEIDLRRASILGDSAIIEINAVFGGVEVKVPQMWRADVQGVGVFGGFSDETIQPDPSIFPVIKNLVVKGSAVFGGVVIKN